MPNENEKLLPEYAATDLTVLQELSARNMAAMLTGIFSNPVMLESFKATADKGSISLEDLISENAILFAKSFIDKINE